MTRVALGVLFTSTHINLCMIVALALEPGGSVVFERLAGVWGALGPEALSFTKTSFTRHDSITNNH